MSDLNICTFTGRLGADPEIKSFQNGGRIANLRLAVGSSWKDRQTGERKERTEWVSVSITNDGLIGVAERFLKKGSRIAISGEFRTRKWSDQQGNDRYTSEIVLAPYSGTLTMLDSANSGQGGGQARGGNGQSQNRQSGHGNDDWGSGGGSWGDALDDDIGF